MDNLSSFGEWIKGRRKTLDLTQAELAERASCTVFALRKIESGYRRPSKQLAGLLARSLEIAPEDHITFIRAARGELGIERLPALAPARARHLPIEPESIPFQTNIPAELTPVIGREAELAALKTLIANPNCRLLSITGMGGVGKTRLAIEFAAQQQDSFPGGVYYVPLASLNSAELIVPAIIDVLGFRLSGEPDPQEQLLRYLQARNRQAILMVLDNLEHLLAPSGQENGKTDATLLIKNMLHRHTNLKMLVTSRERICVQGEWIFELEGLPFPTGAQTSQLDEYSATVLFVQRARQVNASFELLPEDWPALVRVCQFVDGTPLAIELAAAWAGMLSMKEIAQEIESNLDFLKISMRDIPERHRSLRATFEYSWRLLSFEEQQGLCRLAVFQGGFQREAAMEVASTPLPILMSLYTKSLLLRRKNGRYDLHDVVRQYALSHLQHTSEFDSTLKRYCRFYLAFARDQEKALEGPYQSDANDVLAVELDNLRAVMAWGLKNRHAECTLKIAISLGRFWFSRGYWREGVEWLENGLVSEGDIALDVRAKALTEAGRLKRYLGDYPRAIAMLQESLGLWQRIGEPTGIIQALTNLGDSYSRQGDVIEATERLEIAFELSLQNGYRAGMYSSLEILGQLASWQGSSQRAIDLYEDALKLAKEAGDDHQIAKILNILGDEYSIRGDYDRAEECFRQGEMICRNLGNRIVAAYICGNRGFVAFKKGNYERAYDLLLETMQVLQELGDKENLILCLEPMAYIALEQHLPERAIRLLGASEANRRNLGVILSKPNQAEHDVYATRARSQLSEPALAMAWEEGRKMTFEQAIAFAVDWNTLQIP